MIVIDADSIALVISRGDLYAHVSVRNHAVAASHAALAILSEGRSVNDTGAALVKEMSRWLEATRRATLEEAAQTVSALR